MSDATTLAVKHPRGCFSLPTMDTKALLGGEELLGVITERLGFCDPVEEEAQVVDRLVEGLDALLACYSENPETLLRVMRDAAKRAMIPTLPPSLPSTHIVFLGSSSVLASGRNGRVEAVNGEPAARCPFAPACSPQGSSLTTGGSRSTQGFVFR